MPTFKAVVLKHQIRPNKTVNILIRVTHNRKSKYINTGITASNSDLTKSLKIKTSSFIDDTNESIKSYRNKCNAQPERVSVMTCEQLIEFLTVKEKVISYDFLEFAETHIRKINEAGRKTTARDYQTAINALKRYVLVDSLHVSEITVKFLQKFSEWIVHNPINAKKATKSIMSRAPSHYLGSIRTIHNEMKSQYNDEDSGLILIPGSPFAKFKIPKPVPTRKRAIDAVLINKLYNLPDKKTSSDIVKQCRYNLAKDCFILSFCLIGMNSADLFDCDEMNLSNIIYKRKKTRGRRNDKAEISINIEPEIKHLIDRYRDPEGKKVFSFHKNYADESNFNKAINIGLKEIGKLIGVDDLEFYAARHSWATIALNKVGIDKYTVHSALNHVEEAMKVTDIYLDKDWSLINNANRKVLDFVFKDKEVQGNIEPDLKTQRPKKGKSAKPIPQT